MSWHLAVVAPSMIASQKGADRARCSLTSLQAVIESDCPIIVVDDVPRGRLNVLGFRVPSRRFWRKAREVYQGPGIMMIRRLGSGSNSACLRAIDEAAKVGASHVFLHMDDNVYLPIMRDMWRYSEEAFETHPSLMQLKFTGFPILCPDSSRPFGNRCFITIEADHICFEHIMLLRRRYSDFSLWHTPYSPTMVDGRFWPFAMWFTIYRTEFLRRILTFADVPNLVHLANVEDYYRINENWKRFVSQIDGEIGFINMQFGGFEMHQHGCWNDLIELPNDPVL